MSLEQPEFFRLFLASSWVQVILLYKQLFFLHTQTHRKVGSFLNYSSQFELCLKKVEHPQSALYVFSHQVHVISVNRYNLIKAPYENYYEHFILEEGKWITVFLFLLWHANSLTFTHYANFKEEAVSMSENQQWQ